MEGLLSERRRRLLRSRYGDARFEPTINMRRVGGMLQHRGEGKGRGIRCTELPYDVTGRDRDARFALTMVTRYSHMTLSAVTGMPALH